MFSTKMFGYVKFVFLLFIFHGFIISAYSDDTPESRREPVHKKTSQSNNLKVYDSMKSDSSTSKIVFEPQSSNTSPATSVTTNKDSTNDNSKNKNINKRQQFSQAKPVRQLPNRRTEPPKKRVDSCPLCDSSVFSYCSDKLLHDACCCLNPFETNLPYQCQYADCSFLHANSCREHHLITACCCDRYLFQV